MCRMPAVPGHGREERAQPRMRHVRLAPRPLRLRRDLHVQRRATWHHVRESRPGRLDALRGVRRSMAALQSVKAGGCGRMADRQGRTLGHRRRDQGARREKEASNAMTRSIHWGDERLPERFWNRCVPEPTSGCWLWIAGGICHGYGRFRVAGKDILTHRLTYEILIGPIPAGLQIDHLCRVQCCCNPAHLEPVTNAENTRRGLAPILSAKRNRAKTHCPHGHEYTPENTLVKLSAKGTQGRQCRLCKAADDVRRRRANGEPVRPIGKRHKSVRELLKRRGVEAPP